ncbi:MAG: thioesterase [Gaiellaceae bacterium]
MEPLVPPPREGRTYRSTRRIRLADRDASGRLRLDAVARFVQDVATDDVDETGWGAPDHLWVVRSMRIDVLSPPVEDDHVELLTWCSGTGGVVAGRRMSLIGDLGGRVEVDGVWVHLGPDARPARIEGFEVYAGSAEGRVLTTKLELTEPERPMGRFPWHVRVADLDLMGHANNAVYLAAVEECLARGGPDPRRPLRACVDYRHPIDLGEDVELAVHVSDEHLALAFHVDGGVKAVARVEPL